MKEEKLLKLIAINNRKLARLEVKMAKERKELAEIQAKREETKSKIRAIETELEIIMNRRSNLKGSK